MPTYLDPRADLTFKKVFGQHKALLISFLNALLPLKDNEPVEDIEYLSPEMVPETPTGKFSIVDVRCTDSRGRQFIVEMQMIWTPQFTKRIMVNTSKAIVMQVKQGDDYSLLQPVYSLNLINQVFEPELDDYYHPYAVVNQKHPEKVIDGLSVILIELPKFKPNTFNEKKMHVLWLRFLTEINDKTTEISDELTSQPEVKKAIDVLKKSAFTQDELLAYEKFWDTISSEKTIIGEAIEKGRAEGRAEGIAEGRMEEKLENARKMLQRGIEPAVVTDITGLTMEQIKGL